jgi:hypothetical protein
MAAGESAWVWFRRGRLGVLSARSGRRADHSGVLPARSGPAGGPLGCALCRVADTGRRADHLGVLSARSGRRADHLGVLSARSGRRADHLGVLCAGLSCREHTQVNVRTAQSTPEWSALHPTELDQRRRRRRGERLARSDLVRAPWPPAPRRQRSELSTSPTAVGPGSEQRILSAPWGKSDIPWTSPGQTGGNNRSSRLDRHRSRLDPGLPRPLHFDRSLKLSAQIGRSA